MQFYCLCNSDTCRNFNLLEKKGYDFEVSFFNLDFACSFFGSWFFPWKRKILSGPTLPLSLNTFFFYLLDTIFSFLLLTLETQLNSEPWNPGAEEPSNTPSAAPSPRWVSSPRGKGKDKATENTNCPFSSHKKESGSTLPLNQTSHPFFFGSLVL